MEGFNVTFPGSKRVDVSFNAFDIKTDQSVKHGGEGSAPEPFDLFLASLATCAGIYAKVFCDSRKIQTDRMRLTLAPSWKEGQDRLAGVNITLHVTQAFPEKYIGAVIKSMSGCTVKKQLHPDIAADVQVVYQPD